MALSSVNIFFGVGVIISQIFIATTILYFLFLRKRYPPPADFFSKNGILFSFLTAASAMIGSLFYSNVMGFAPCDLCWAQRIFMFPEVFILGLALLKKDRKITDYALILALVGGVISVYHNYIYYRGISSTFCRIGESCIFPFVTELGYITIPMMSLTAFSLIILFLLSVKRTESQVKP